VVELPVAGETGSQSRETYRKKSGKAPPGSREMLSERCNKWGGGNQGSPTVKGTAVTMTMDTIERAKKGSGKHRHP